MDVFQRAHRSLADAEFKRKVADLAKGFSERFERDCRLVGPLIKDYEYVAEHLLMRCGVDA